MLFNPTQIGTLALPNRLVRSATAERLADEKGRPRPQLKPLWQALARGGVGLIISGHMYVHPSGKCHPEMIGIYSDELIEPLSEMVEAVHQEGGRIAAQVNHGGMQSGGEHVETALIPSAVQADWLRRPVREIRPGEIEETIQAYAQAARRTKLAGFDAVQIHGAHGYLISQFLSPFTNRRKDKWGGDIQGRTHFLRAVCAAVRQEVGPDYPLLIKLGLMDGMEGGLTVAESLQVAAALEGMGLNAVEISGGIAGGRNLNTRPKIRRPEDEAYFRPQARLVRAATNLPLILVGGLRSRQVMEDILDSGDADLISLCRPLICEPDLPKRLQADQKRAACISGNRCWPDGPDEGIACKCRLD
ncbi:MAG: NADH:flavin oxidoreductase [Chloroflexia bacterium]|nr:NADH:flavin oxidoreductase [Chloroflexia bacterium]